CKSQNRRVFSCKLPVISASPFPDSTNAEIGKVWQRVKVARILPTDASQQITSLDSVEPVSITLPSPDMATILRDSCARKAFVPKQSKHPLRSWSLASCERWIIPVCPAHDRL